MNKKYNMKKTTEVMKQKIFSLLLLMAATVSTAWADDAYTLKLRLVIENYVAETEITDNLTSAYTIDPSILEYLVRNAENGGTKPFYEAHSITIGDGHDPLPSDGSINIVGGITIDDPSTSPNHLRDDASVKLDVTVQMTAEESSKQQFVDPNCANLSIKVYHNKHTDNHGTGTDGDGTWQHSDTHHWQGCGNDYGKCVFSISDTDHSNYPCYHEHVYGTDPSLASYYTCQTPGCGYVNNDRKPAHAHNYSTQWYNITTDPDATAAIAACDATKHWHKCTNNIGTCEASESRKDMAAHSFDDDAHDAKYYTCSVCSYEDGTRNTAHSTHTYAWKYDENLHWKECTAAGVCDALIDPGNSKTAHTYDATGDERFTCTVCGYVSPTRKAAFEAIDANAANPAWSWDYEIPFPFDATNISNDRKLKTEQAYTICLPYDLKLNGLKVYFMEKMSDKLVGFREQTITELPAFTPCVVIAAAVGNPLSMAGGKVKKTTDIADRKAVGDGGSYGGNILMGSLKYIAGADAKDLYIMQAADEENPQGSFKKIADDQGDYGNADPALHYCVLPQRAYLAVTASPSREILNAWFFDADGTTKVVDRLVIDEDAAPAIYDLQGRKVSNPQRGGLYIINGKKMIMK